MIENATQTAETAQFIGGNLFMIVLLVAFVTWLLNVILFFKIWGMTNNVEKIKETLEEWLDVEHPVITERDTTDESSEVKP